MNKLIIGAVLAFILVTPLFTYAGHGIPSSPRSRSEYLLSFTTITMITGFSMLIFFVLAGTLPFLYIGTIIK